MIMKTFKTVTTQELTTIVCDGCGLQASANSDFEFQEFISISKVCGYGSIHGDNNKINVDLCQQCFADNCGDALKITGEVNDIDGSDNVDESSQLEHSNISGVIYHSKVTATRLKDDCDVSLAARGLISNNKIKNKRELSIALKRIEQLWGAGYQSIEGNELHQLADLITGNEKKDWESYFSQAPLADDDFMPNRPNFESKETFETEHPAKGVLSNLSINTEIDDESSRDSALAESGLNKHMHSLLVCIIEAKAKYPELRVGQLLINVINPEQPCPELFHINDALLIEKLNQFLASPPVND